jgi:predicted dehydrogenase
MYWLLGAEPVNVSAYSLPLGNAEPIGENNLVASFRFADGSIGNLSYSTVGSRTSAGERVEVFAQGINVTVEDFKRLIINGAVRREHSRFWPEKGYLEQMKSFIASIRKGEAPAVTVRDGARATVACLQMLDSARELVAKDVSFDLIGT